MADPAAFPALDALKDQPRVRDFLASAAAEGRLASAYLFCGAPGSGQLEAARAVAKLSVVPDVDPDIRDAEYRNIDNDAHPDVRVLQPESAVGYLVDQAREVVEAAERTPVRGPMKVFIVDRAETLRGAAANALLKTVEEPSPDTRFVLIAPSPDDVLPTLVSRCQVVPFSVADPGAAAAQVVARAKDPQVGGASVEVTEAEAVRALSFCRTPAEAAEFLASPERRQVRDRLVAVLGSLRSMDAWAVSKAAQELTEAAVAARSTGEEKTEEELEREQTVREDYLTKGAIKTLEQQEKREMAARERSGIMELVAELQSLLRDALVAAQSIDQPPANDDAAAVVASIAERSSVEGLTAAVACASRAAEDVVSNVTPRLAVEVMLLSVKEALCSTSYR